MDKKIYRTPDKKFLGVCGGIADYFNIDPTIVRIIVALVGLYTTVIPILLAYFIAALIIPSPPENYYQIYNNTSARLTKGHSKMISGVCSGLSERLSCDATIIRLLFVLSVILFGFGIAAYIAFAIIMPQPYDGFYNGQNPGNPNGYNDSNNFNNGFNG